MLYNNVYWVYMPNRIKSFSTLFIFKLEKLEKKYFYTVKDDFFNSKH